MWMPMRARQVRGRFEEALACGFGQRLAHFLRQDMIRLCRHNLLRSQMPVHPSVLMASQPTLLHSLHGGLVSVTGVHVRISAG